MGGKFAGNYFLSYLGEQTVHMSPLVFVLLFFAVYFGLKTYFKKKDDRPLILMCFSLPVFLGFGLISFKTMVFAHWPVCGYFALSLLLAGYLSEEGAKRTLWGIAAFDVLVIAVLFFVSPAVMLHQGQYADNYKLAQKIDKYSHHYIYAANYGSAAQLTYYLKRPVNYPLGLLGKDEGWGAEQFRLWGQPKLVAGDNLFFYGPKDPGLEKRLRKYFAQVKMLPGLELYTLEHNSEGLAAYYCRILK
jgi:hypothetical protein